MLEGKIIVVAGGAGLLGSQFCSAIAQSGAFVVVADNNLNAARRVTDEITGNGYKAEAVALDITDRVSVDALITQVQEKHTHIDAVVNSAYPRNRNYGRKLEDVTYEDFCENLNLHLGGYFLVAQRFALFFKNQGGGNVVNLASIYGTMAPRFDVYAETNMTMPIEYAAIKSAIIQLSRYLAQYLKTDGVRVNSLSPGGIRDNQPDAFLERYDTHSGNRGMLDTKDVVGSLLFLLSDASESITGQNLIVDDGFSL
jgi:NAD(P)-dependent dehydrogenase (short-subunit alcohol dehydrogenase family)